MEATADQGVLRRLAEVLLLVAMPIAVPVVWVAGVMLVVQRKPPGWKATLAMSPFGLAAPMWLYGHSTGARADLPAQLGIPLAVVLTIGCLVAAWRLTSR